MNSYLTDQTDIDLPNIRSVSDLGPHTENHNQKDQIPFDLCCSHCLSVMKKTPS